MELDDPYSRNVDELLHSNAKKKTHAQTHPHNPLSVLVSYFWCFLKKMELTFNVFKVVEMLIISRLTSTVF